MNKIKKITALILTLAIGFSICMPSAKAETTEPKNFEEYREMLEDEGYPAMSTEQFFKGIEVYRFLTGRGFIEQEYFNFKTDELTTELCEYIAQESGLDIMMIVTHLPETNQYVEFVTETFNIDTVALRDEFMRLRDEQDAQGNGTGAMILHFLGVYMSIIDECEAYCVPLEDDKNSYEIHLRVKMRDGAEENVETGIIIDTETGEVYGKGGNGILGIGYDFDASQMLLYAQVNVWMRNFGFTVLYDLFSYSTPFFFYNTRRIKFDYDGLEWMVQIWKGNYLISNGAEVGIYNREPGSIGIYYNCANSEQETDMSMKLYHGDDLLFERPEQRHWWITGFRISDRLYPAKTLTLDFTIEMKDEEMLNAFCEAVENHYRNDMSYTVDGLTVNVIW